MKKIIINKILSVFIVLSLLMSKQTGRKSSYESYIAGDEECHIFQLT